MRWTLKVRFGPQPLLARAYLENVRLNAQVPSQVVPPLLPKALPVHAVVDVDVFLPGCRPSSRSLTAAA